jgi:hypothetical protein
MRRARQRHVEQDIGIDQRLQRSRYFFLSAS